LRRSLARARASRPVAVLACVPFNRAEAFLSRIFGSALQARVFQAPPARLALAAEVASPSADHRPRDVRERR